MRCAPYNWNNMFSPIAICAPASRIRSRDLLLAAPRKADREDVYPIAVLAKSPGRTAAHRHATTQVIWNTD